MFFTPKNFFKKYNRGFTLVEVLVSLFLFVILMAAIAQIFTSAFTGYRSTKTIQRDLEVAQFAMNTIAKELRTSSIVSSSGNQSSVQFYDHSQGECFRYRVPGNTLQVASSSATSASDCSSLNPSSFTTIVTGIVSGGFFVTPSDGASSPKRVGKITISLEIGEGETHRARIQSSASLRDYGNAGLFTL